MTIEQKIIELLETALMDGSSGISVSASVPHPMPNVFVTVEKTGASETNLIPSAQIHINCYSTSRASAAALCDLVIRAMTSTISDAAISQVSLSASYNNPDLTTLKPRYSAVFQVVHLI